MQLTIVPFCLYNIKVQLTLRKCLEIYRRNVGNAIKPLPLVVFSTVKNFFIFKQGRENNHNVKKNICVFPVYTKKVALQICDTYTVETPHGMKFLSVLMSTLKFNCAH